MPGAPPGKPQTANQKPSEAFPVHGTLKTPHFAPICRDPIAKQDSSSAVSVDMALGGFPVPCGALASTSERAAQGLRVSSGAVFPAWCATAGVRSDDLHLNKSPISSQELEAMQLLLTQSAAVRHPAVVLKWSTTQVRSAGTPSPGPSSSCWCDPGRRPHLLKQAENQTTLALSIVLESLSACLPLATPWTEVYQAPPPVGFCRQNEWVPCLLQSSSRASRPSQKGSKGQSFTVDQHLRHHRLGSQRRGGLGGLGSRPLCS